MGGFIFFGGGGSHCNIWGKKGGGWSKHELSVHWTKSSFAPSTHTFFTDAVPLDIPIHFQTLNLFITHNPQAPAVTI